MLAKSPVKTFLNFIISNSIAMKTKIINGRKFDADMEQVLSWRDKSYRLLFDEFKPDQIRMFIDYLTSGTVLDWEWNSRGGYNDLDYTTAGGDKKSISGNHGLTEIIKHIEYGKLDPSEVLHDFTKFYRGCNSCDKSSKQERQKLYQEVKDLIQKGFSVEVIDHS